MSSGDQSAMAELYDRYSGMVYAVALRILGDTGAAEDVLQEIFLQLWRNPGAFDAARGSLGAWLAVIARTRAIDSLRRRRPETDIEDVVLSVAPDLASEANRSRAAEKVRGVLGAMASPQQERRPGPLPWLLPSCSAGSLWRDAYRFVGDLRARQDIPTSADSMICWKTYDPHLQRHHSPSPRNCLR